MNALDIAILLLFLVCAAIYVKGRLETVKAHRRAALGDEVDFDDWKNGTPNDPVPDDAKPFKTDV
jgi:hypothetical protein